MRELARPSFPEIAEMIAEVACIDAWQITPGTRLEGDLGIWGDDGWDLLEALAEKYGTNFNRPCDGRYLFSSEGWDPFTAILRLLTGWPHPIIPITAGDLHLAVLRGRWEDPPWRAT